MSKNSPQMIGYTSRRCCTWLAGILFLSGLICTSVALAGSDTGRSAAEETTRGSSGRWSFRAGAGVMTSGDLFEVIMPSGMMPEWIAPDGETFHSDEFVVTLDEDLQTAVCVAFLLADAWWLRFDLSWSQANATAEARVGQTVELYRYDQLTFLLSGLTIERSLINTDDYVYVLAGAVLVDVSAANGEGLDQTVLGWRFGMGFHHAFDERWGARFEIRDTLQQLDMGEHTPRAIGTEVVAMEFMELGPQHLFELTFSIGGLF